MNAKISAFVICVEAIIYLLFYNLHDFTFKKIVKEFDFLTIFINIATAIAHYSPSSSFNILLVFFLFSFFLPVVLLLIN